MMKILIVGSNGMLGQELVRFLRNGHDIIPWNKKDLDVTSRDIVISKINEVNPEVIINASAFNDVDGAEIDEDLKQMSLCVNGFAPGYLAEAAKNINSVFVHYSTDYVFDGNEMSYQENSITSPISNHGISKAEGERRIKEVGGHWYIVRLSRLFGKPSESDIGKKSFFQKIIDLSKTRKEIKVINNETSCFTYAPDLAESTKKLIENKYPYGVYHLINEGHATWYEGAMELVAIFGVCDTNIIPVSFDEFSRIVRIPKSSILVNTKFPKLRHFKDAISEWKIKSS